MSPKGSNYAVAQHYPAMRTLDLIVHIGTKLNRSHLLVGKESSPIPCLGRTTYPGKTRGIVDARPNALLHSGIP